VTGAGWTSSAKVSRIHRFASALRFFAFLENVFATGAVRTQSQGRGSLDEARTASRSSGQSSQDFLTMEM
jgi:hypothetical protein